MAFKPDAAAIVEINNHRGVDSSVAITRVPDGYCREMENCDISTAGIVKKRPGYVTWGGKLPVLGNGTVRSPNNHLYYRVDKTADTAGKQKIFKWAEAKVLIQKECGIDVTEFSGTIYQNITGVTFFAIQMLDTDPALNYNLMFPVTAAKTTHGYAPVAIYGRYAIMGPEPYAKWRTEGIITNKAMSAIGANGESVLINVTPVATGYVFERFDSTTITAVELISEIVVTGTGIAAKFTTVNPLPYGTSVFLPGLGDGCVLDTDGTSYFSIQFRIPPSLTENFTDITQLDSYVILYSLESYITGGWWHSPVATNATFAAYIRIEYDNYPFNVAGWQFGQSVNPGDVQTVESYYNTLTGKEELSCLLNGTLFKLDDSAVPTYASGGITYSYVLTTLTPPAIAATQTVSKVNGVYELNFTNAYQYYVTGDKVDYILYDIFGVVKSSYTFTVSSSTATKLRLSNDDYISSIVFYVNSIMHYTRYSRAVWVESSSPGYSKTFPGDTVFIGGFGSEYPAHEIRFLGSSITPGGNYPLSLLFKNPVTYSSGINLYTCPRWEEVAWNDENYYASATAVTPTYGVETTPKNSDIVSSTSFSAGMWFASKEDGVYRYNGTDVHSLKFLRPQVMSARSVKGSKGTFGVRNGDNNEKIGKQVQCLFVFSVLDSTNTIMESETSSESEGVFTPSASIDGSNKAEVIEYLVSPCLQLSQLPAGIKLDVYTKVIDPTETAVVEYGFYRSVDVVPGVPIVVTVGDLSAPGIDDDTVRRVYTLANKNHWPCMYGKYLTTVANRMVMLNCRTYDYHKLRILKNFKDADNNFGAYVHYKVPTLPTPGTEPAVVAATVTVNAGTNRLTKVAHGYVDGVYGYVTATVTMPAPLESGKYYWVLKYDNDEFYLCTNGANVFEESYINITGAGAGTITFTPLGYSFTAFQGLFMAPLGITPVAYAETACVADPALEKFTKVSHGLVTGQRIRFTSGTMPTSLVEDKPYYVIRIDADTFYVAEYLSQAVRQDVADRVVFGSAGVDVKYTADGFNAVSNQSDLTGYPSSPYPTFSAYMLDYYNEITAAISGKSGGAYYPLTLTYQDSSIFFTVSAAASEGDTDNSVKFRAVGRSTLQGLPIDFLGGIFQTVTAPASVGYYTVKSPTPWTDASLDATGRPTALNDVRFVAFYRETALTNNLATADSVQQGNYFISITTDSSNKATIKLVYIDTLSDIVPDASVVVLHGPGTLGNLHRANDSTILSWDRDLIFLSGSTGASSFIIGTTTYQEISLTPIEVVEAAAGGVSTSAYDVFGDNVANDAADLTYGIKVFLGQTALGFKQLYGFSLPSTTMTVKIHQNIENTLDDTTVGDYVTFVLASEDRYQFPAGFPDISEGSFRVLSQGNAANYDYITIEVPYSKSTYVSSSISTIGLGSKSCCVNLNLLIKSTSDGFEMPLRSRSGTVFSNAVPTTGYKCFVNIRGVDFGSTNYKLSGWYVNENGTQNVGAISLDYTNFLTGTGPTIDYSKISGVEFASVIVSSTYWPVPVPKQLGLAESLTDLALPMFSRDSLLTDVPLVQVGKRIVECINSTEIGIHQYGLQTSLWSGPAKSIIECAPNEIIILSMNREADKYRIYPFPSYYGVDFVWFSEGSGYEEFFDITRYNANTEIVETVTVGTDFVKSGKFFSDDKPNTLMWTSSLTDSSLGSSIPQFEQGNVYALNTEDDSEILGAAPYQNALIVSKKNSMWRGLFADDGSVSFQKIQSPTGSYSHNNMPTTDSFMYFIHPSGVFALKDGYEAKPVGKLDGLFRDKVSKSSYLLQRTAGYVDTVSKQVYIGTPYLSEFIDNVAAVDGQFNYAYDEIFGWQVNIGIDAYKWCSFDSQYFFASSRGRVYKMRTEQHLTQYRDGEDAIGSALVTRFLSAGEATRFKFWRNVLFQFGGTSNFTFSTYYATNYAPARTAMETYPVTGEVLENGAKWFGNERLLRTLRETFAQRVQSISFTLTEGSIDTDCPIYTVAVEGFETNTRLVRQKATSGDRT